MILTDGVHAETNVVPPVTGGEDIVMVPVPRKMMASCIVGRSVAITVEMIISQQAGRACRRRCYNRHLFCR